MKKTFKYKGEWKFFLIVRKIFLIKRNQLPEKYFN